MKKISIVLIFISLVVMFSAIFYSFAEESSEYKLIDEKEAKKLDASLLIYDGGLYPISDEMLSNAPLYIFLGIDDRLERLDTIENANIIVFRTKENEKESTRSFIFHYINLINKYDNFFTEIRFLSVYDDLLVKVFDELCFFIDNGKFETSILPDRFTQFNNKFIDKTTNNVYNMLYEKIVDKGVAIEKYDIAENLEHNDFISSLYTYGKVEPFDYYLSLFNKDIPIDNCVSNSKSLGLSPILPLSYLKGRVGTSFVLENGIQKSINIVGAEVCGIIFYDVDLNGYYDSKWDILYEGAHVKAFLTYKGLNKLLSFDTTDEKGFYRLRIPKINANSFDKIFIEAEKKDGLKLTFRSNETFLMNNDMNADYKSDEVVFGSPVELKIINIGYRD